MTCTLRSSARAGPRRPARHRRRGRRWAAHLRGGGSPGARRLPGRGDGRRRTRPGPRPLAQPDRGRPVLLRRAGAPAAPQRTGGPQRDPRSGPLGLVGRRRAGAPSGPAHAPAPSSAGLPLPLRLSVDYALAPDGLTVTHECSERGRRRLPVRHRGAPLPAGRGHHPRHLGAPLARAYRPAVGRARDPALPSARLRDAVRLPGRPSGGRPRHRPRLHRSRALRRRARDGHRDRPRERTCAGAVDGRVLWSPHGLHRRHARAPVVDARAWRWNR